MTEPAALADTISDEVSTVLVGMDELIEQLTISLLTRGHVLLEGVPGVAKTTLAHTFARASGLSFTRIQMTPDILPADITGTTVYREQTGEFELRKGPVFSNVAVADEINRATPKTQSALLEAMAEGHVSIDGETLGLPTPFFVIATQNPIEMEGTFELPEAQRDRFQQKLTVETPDAEMERSLLDQFHGAPTMGPDDVEAVVSPAEIQDARDTVTDVHVADAVRDYVVDIITATRGHENVTHGASPRGTLALLQTAKARAAIRGRSYVTSDDVKQLAKPILRHRLVLTTDAELSDTSPIDIIEDIQSSIVPPEGNAAQTTPSGSTESTEAFSDAEETRGKSAGTDTDDRPVSQESHDGSAEPEDGTESDSQERSTLRSIVAATITGGTQDESDGQTADDEPANGTESSESDGQTADHDLQRLPRVGQTRAENLREAGYETVSDVLAADWEELERDVTGIGEATAKKILNGERNP